LLEINKDNRKMEGYYWTDRRTRGDIVLEKMEDE